MAALALAAIKGPVEELGWRGFALPMLQRRFAPVWSSLILGLVWGFWHLPAFLLSGTQQSAWSFTPFLAGTVAISVIATALFNASRGSILLAAVLHFQLMNPIWPDAQPYDSVLLAVVAVLVLGIRPQDHVQAARRGHGHHLSRGREWQRRGPGRGPRLIRRQVASGTATSPPTRSRPGTEPSLRGQGDAEGRVDAVLAGPDQYLDTTCWARRV